MQRRSVMKKTTGNEGVEPRSRNGRASRIEAAAATGAVAGAAAGAVAGPVGAMIGAVAGSAMGAMAGVALANDSDRRHVQDAKLDRDIGVTEGGMGAADPTQPPARVGAYSSASSGAAPRRASPRAKGRFRTSTSNRRRQRQRQRPRTGPLAREVRSGQKLVVVGALPAW